MKKRKLARVGNEQRFYIPGELPTWNKIIELNRTFRRRGNKRIYPWAKVKKQWESDIHSILMLYNIKPVKKYPIHVHFHWFAKNRKTDPDNYSTKVVLDALVSGGILVNDGWRQISGINHLFTYKKSTSGLEVALWEDGY